MTKHVFPSIGSEMQQIKVYQGYRWLCLCKTNIRYSINAIEMLDEQSTFGKAMDNRTYVKPPNTSEGVFRQMNSAYIWILTFHSNWVDRWARIHAARTHQFNDDEMKKKKANHVDDSSINQFNSLKMHDNRIWLFAAKHRIDGKIMSALLLSGWLTMIAVAYFVWSSVIYDIFGKRKIPSLNESSKCPADTRPCNLFSMNEVNK